MFAWVLHEHREKKKDSKPEWIDGEKHDDKDSQRIQIYEANWHCPETCWLKSDDRFLGQPDTICSPRTRVIQFLIQTCSQAQWSLIWLNTHSDKPHSTRQSSRKIQGCSATATEIWVISCASLSVYKFSICHNVSMFSDSKQDIQRFPAYVLQFCTKSDFVATFRCAQTANKTFRDSWPECYNVAQRQTLLRRFDVLRQQTRHSEIYRLCVTALCNVTGQTLLQCLNFLGQQTKYSKTPMCCNVIQL